MIFHNSVKICNHNDYVNRPHQVSAAFHHESVVRVEEILILMTYYRIEIQRVTIFKLNLNPDVRIVFFEKIKRLIGVFNRFFYHRILSDEAYFLCLVGNRNGNRVIFQCNTF